MIRFILCSDSDISPSQISKYHVDLLPLYVELDGIIYRPYQDIDGETFLNLLRESKNYPKTSTVSGAEIADRMRNHIDSGNEVIMVTMTIVSSETYQNALLAKEQLEKEKGCELPISVVDSHTFSLVYLNPVFDALALADTGASRMEVVDLLVSECEKHHCIFMLPDLSYLRRGGHILAGTALIGGIMGIIPILTVQDGIIRQITNTRGLKNTSNKMISLIKQDCPSRKLRRVQILQIGREKECRRMEEMMKEEFQIKEFLPTISPEASVIAHTGFDFAGIVYALE
jgi:DegV family protein with EDD domain